MSNNLPHTGSCTNSPTEVFLKEIRSATGEESAKLIQTIDGAPWNDLGIPRCLGTAPVSIESVIHRLASCEGNQLSSGVGGLPNEFHVGEEQNLVIFGGTMDGMSIIKKAD